MDDVHLIHLMNNLGGEGRQTMLDMAQRRLHVTTVRRGMNALLHARIGHYCPLRRLPIEMFRMAGVFLL